MPLIPLPTVQPIRAPQVASTGTPTTWQLVISGVALVLVLIAVAHMTGAVDTSIVSHTGKAARGVRALAARPARPSKSKEAA